MDDGNDHSSRPPFSDKLRGILLLLPALLYDLAYWSLRPLLKFIAPVAFVAIMVFLMAMGFLDLKKDTTSISAGIIAMLISFSALGFGWADAIGNEDPEFEMVIRYSKQFMVSVMAMMLATGFKFALMRIPPSGFLPYDGKSVRFVLWFIMACLFAQAMLEFAVPLIRLNAYLGREESLTPGVGLLKRHLPEAHARMKSWLPRGKHGAGGAKGAAA